MASLKTLDIIYDGRCEFCLRALRVVAALDLRGALRFHDSHRPETLARFPAIRRADVDEAMYTLAEGEPPYRGFFAFRRLLWSSPLTWAIIPLFYLPGADLFGTSLYAWVARNRSKFGCRSGACALPPGPDAGGGGSVG